MLASWQARPSAQAKRESELEAARRIAGNTQRLVCLIGFFTLLGISVMSFSLAAVMIWAGFFANSLSVVLMPFAGALAGVGIVCWTALRRIEHVLEAVIEEERLRLSFIN